MLRFSTFCCLFFFTSSFHHSFGQKKSSPSQPISFCEPGVAGLQRAKGLIIKHETIFDYGISSNAHQEGLPSGQSEVKENERWDVRLRLPVFSKPHLTVALGFKYTKEDYSFDKFPILNNPFFDNLEERPLKSIGTALYVVKPTRNNKYFLLRASADFNGDYNSPMLAKYNFLKFSISPLLGWKINKDLSYAIGLSYNYSFGRPGIYPIFSYNRNFNEKWGIESLLPVNIKLRFKPNEKTFLYASTELNGASYRLIQNDSIFSKFNNLHLHRSEVRFLFNLEKELIDWFWLTAEVGLRSNLNFNLSNSNRMRGEVLVQNRLKPAPIINFGFFIVPPRKFIRK